MVEGREESRFKALLKSTLGKTRAWPYLLKARFFFHRLLAFLVTLPVRTRNRLAVRLASPEKVRDLLLSRDFYGSDYFDSDKNPLLESGYGSSYGENPDFRDVALLARDLLGAKKAMDIGCAKGYLVLALLQESVEAWGVDISQYALDQAPPEVRERLMLADIARAELPEDSFDLLLALEVLEHVSPEEIAGVVKRLWRFTSRYLWATIPSYGANPYGPDGCLEGKILPRCIGLYRDHLIDRAQLHHMTCDLRGLPIHGHLIAASFDWWTALFTSLGFVRRGDLERVINQKVRSAQEGIWNCFLLEKVRPSPLRKPLGLEADNFSPGIHGSWISHPFPLPSGTYRAEARFRLDGSLRGKRAGERILTLSCLSDDSERVYGMRLPTRGELEKSGGMSLAELEWTISSDGMGEAVVRLAPTPGLRLEPLRVNLYPVE